MTGTIDRESLRARLHQWTDRERRLALERLVEHLPDDQLESLLEGLDHLDPHRCSSPQQAPSLLERIERHVAATRGGEFRGEYVIRNAHGQREPARTAAWIATTTHLFDLALARARQGTDPEAHAALRSLVALVHEVDERCDELVVFEDQNARDALGCDLDDAARCLAALAGG